MENTGTSYQSITKVNLDFLGEMIDILEDNKSEAQVREVHEKLKIFVPTGVSELDCIIIWDKAWRSCPVIIRHDPDREAIRKHDVLFCKLLVKKLQY